MEIELAESTKFDPLGGLTPEPLPSELFDGLSFNSESIMWDIPHVLEQELKQIFNECDFDATGSVDLIAELNTLATRVAAVAFAEPYCLPVRFAHALHVAHLLFVRWGAVNALNSFQWQKGTSFSRLV